MAEKLHASARVREISLGVQCYFFILIATALRTFTHIGPAGDLPPELTVAGMATLLAFPFVWARIPPLLGVTPGWLLRAESRIDLHGGGLIYQFDPVKRPLFVAWADLVELRRTRFGLVIRTRPGAALTHGMPNFQASFWSERVKRPVRILFLDPLSPESDAQKCLARAEAAGVIVSGFEAGPEARPQVA